MELKEALISRYNMPLTFVGIEPEKKDLGNFIEYTINNIQKIADALEIETYKLFINDDSKKGRTKEGKIRRNTIILGVAFIVLAIVLGIFTDIEKFSVFSFKTSYF